MSLPVVLGLGVAGAAMLAAVRNSKRADGGGGNASPGSGSGWGKYYDLGDLTVTGSGLDNSPENKDIENNLKWLSQTMDSVIDNVIGYAPRINSGYRNPTVNDAVGGSKSSDHMGGLALDVHIGKASESDFKEKMRIAEALTKTDLYKGGYLDQIIIYDSNSDGTWYGGGGKSHIHLGFNRNGKGRGQILVTPRGNSGTYTTWRF